MFKHVYLIGLLGASLLGLFSFALSGENQEGPSPALSPAAELASFQVAEGLQVQLVAAEPLVQDPVVLSFDADGRLWVVEMRGFMPDIDGAGEKEKTGRISVLEDTNGDGRMDAATVYLDSLVMPRALALVEGGALVVENQALWLTQDLNGDLRADTKTLIDAAYAGSALPEHAGNGLWRGMDHWYYNAKSRLRYRQEKGRWLRDSTEFRGQWGISHDDQGRLYYNYNWSQLHADLVPPNYLSRNKHHQPTTGIDQGLSGDRRIYPIRPTPAVNRGYIPGTLDAQGRLVEFTSACSPFYYRGRALPPPYYGNVFVCEPSGNLIKRNVVLKQGFGLAAKDPSPGLEFLASTDERFRPVHLASGPDGALYVADMYRGLIQHGAYLTPYLQQQTLARQLVRPINRGRIWRIVPQGWQPPKPRKLSAAATPALVELLEHPDGWHRDMAQRLLTERGDPASSPLLRALALKGKKPLGRFHALWTLEGLKVLKPELLFRLLPDADPLIQATALRLLEPFARRDKQVRAKLATIVQPLWRQASETFILQLALSAGVLEPTARLPLLAAIAQKHASEPLLRDALLSSLENQEYRFLTLLLASPAWQQHRPEREIFLEMLSTAIARKADPTELTGLLALLDVKKQATGWRENALLTGLAIQGSSGNSKPVHLAAAPAIFSRPHLQGNPARLQALARLFTWPGHEARSEASPGRKPLPAEAQALFALGRQHYLTTCAGCHGTDGAGIRRFAPPLIQSEWVLGDEKRLALILLHGMDGPVQVNGHIYQAPDILPAMPAQSTLDDAVIAALMTYIRNEWGHQAAPVSRRTVATTRVTSQGRVMPWTAAELHNALPGPKAAAEK